MVCECSALLASFARTLLRSKAMPKHSNSTYLTSRDTYQAAGDWLLASNEDKGRGFEFEVSSSGFESKSNTFSPLRPGDAENSGLGWGLSSQQLVSRKSAGWRDIRQPRAGARGRLRWTKPVPRCCRLGAERKARSDRMHYRDGR